MSVLIGRYNSKINSICTRKPLFLTMSLARTSLAIGTLTTFIFNNSDTLFDETEFGRLNFNDTFNFINIFYLFGFEYIYLYRITCIAIMIFVISGYYPRITGVLHWLVSYSFFKSGLVVDGGDQITAVLTLLLIPITLADNRKNHWFQSNESESNYFPANISWAIIRIQMAFLYLQSGIEKIYQLEDWKNGTALYYFFNDPVYGSANWAKPILNYLFLNGLLSYFLCWGIIVFEIILFGAYFIRKNKRHKLLIPAIIFHISIAVFLGLVSFSFAMTGGLILYLSSKRIDKKILSIISTIKSVFHLKR